MSLPTLWANVFDATGHKDADELNKKMAAYAAAATNASSLAQLDGLTRQIEKELSDPTNAAEILDHYRTSAIVPMSLLGAARAAVGASQDATKRREETTPERVTKRVTAQDKFVARKRTVDFKGDEDDAHAAKDVYSVLVLLGALWYSGYLSTMLSVLGWTDVRIAIDEITFGKVGKEPKREVVMKQLVGALKKRASTGFGSLAVDAGTHEGVLRDQTDTARRLGSESIEEEAKQALTPAFLAAHIRARTKWANETYKKEMEAERRDVVHFRLIVSAVASTLFMLTKECLAFLQPSFKKQTSGALLSRTIFKLLKFHTTIPNSSVGVFQRLRMHLNTAEADMGTVGLKTLHDTDMRDLVARLATAEQSGIIASLMSSTVERARKTPTQFQNLFSALLPNHALTSDYESADVIHLPEPLGLILSELKKDPPVAAMYTKEAFSPAGDGDFSHMENALSESIVLFLASTRIEHYADPQMAPIFERASASVSLAKRAVYKQSEDHLQLLLGDLTRMTRSIHSDKTEGVKKTLYDLLWLALTRDTKSAAWASAMNEEADNLSLHRAIMSSFLDATMRSDSKSASKFLVMARQLMRINVEFTPQGLLPHTEIYQKARDSLNDTGSLQKLTELADGHFKVEENDITGWKLVGFETNPERQYHAYARFPSKFVSQFDPATKKTRDALVAERGRLLKANRQKEANDVSGKIHALLSEHPPSAQLTVDYLRYINDEKTSADRMKRIADLEKDHDAYRNLVGVGKEEARAAAAEDRNQVYGVLFMHTRTDSQTVSEVWHFYVHIHVDGTLVSADGKLRADKLRDLINAARERSGVKNVVFGLDEWPENTLQKDWMLINGSKLVAQTTLGNDMRDENTLYVHRWPEMELIPAPFGFATPMFKQRPPEAILGVSQQGASNDGVSATNPFRRGSSYAAPTPPRA
jgi:hypothetical protein